MLSKDVSQVDGHADVKQRFKYCCIYKWRCSPSHTFAHTTRGMAFLETVVRGIDHFLGHGAKETRGKYKKKTGEANLLLCFGNVLSALFESLLWK